MISTTASTATKPPPRPNSARRIKIPLPPAPPTTPRLGVPPPPPPPPPTSYSSSSSSLASSTTSSARHSPSASLSSLGSVSSYSSAATSLSVAASTRSLRYRSGSCRHTAPSSPKCAELAGGTAAECAVVFCCCPCGIVNLLYLAVLKLPAGLCRKAIRNRRRRILAKKRGGNTTMMLRDDDDDDGLLVLGRTAVLSPSSSPASLWPVDSEPSEEMWEMDKEMWDLFYGTGFWRSPSQREGDVII